MDEHTLNLRPPVWALIAAVIIGGAFYLAGKNLERDPEAEGTITVTGEGRAFAVPDIAELTFGVQTGPQPSAKIAMDKLQRDMTAVIDAVKGRGIEEKDIMTQQLSLNPQYDWASGRQRLIGYEAIQSLLVKVRDLDKVGEVLESTTTVGANQIGGVSFRIDDPEELRADARADAIEQAQARAEELADQLGVDLGDLQSFNEGFGGVPPPMPMYDRMSMGGAMNVEEQSMAVPSGEQEVTVTVTLTYELD